MEASERNVMVATPDDVPLATDIYHPDVEGSFPTLLQRTCYNKDFLADYIGLDRFLAAGYRVVLQDCRGSGKSGGEADHFCESADGRTTADWIADQPWFDGSLATFGSSYMGMTQWALAATRPPYLKAMAVGLTTSRVWSWFPRGSLALDIFLSWSMTRVLGFSRAQEPDAQARLQKAFMHLPMREAALVATGQDPEWYQRWMNHPNSDDPFWDGLNFSCALDLPIPILLLDQWYDYATDHVVEEFALREDAGLPTRLHIGPGTHFAADSSQFDETLRWFDLHLKGIGTPTQGKARVFVLPEHGWTDLRTWPPASTADTWYLGPGGVLARECVPESAPTPFVYDPADPTPAVGGPSLRMDNCGAVDNRELESRADVLTFTTPPLEEDTPSLGRVVVTLHMSSDVDHLDVYVRLCDVQPDGMSINTSESLQRLHPDNVTRIDGIFAVSLALRSFAYIYQQGHRIRLQISGGAHPMYARNTCSGEPPTDATAIVVAHNCVHHDVRHPSTLALSRPLEDVQ